MGKSKQTKLEVSYDKLRRIISECEDTVDFDNDGNIELVFEKGELVKANVYYEPNPEPREFSIDF